MALLLFKDRKLAACSCLLTTTDHLCSEYKTVARLFASNLSYNLILKYLASISYLKCTKKIPSMSLCLLDAPTQV